MSLGLNELMKMIGFLYFIFIYILYLVVMLCGEVCISHFFELLNRNTNCDIWFWNKNLYICQWNELQHHLPIICKLTKMSVMEVFFLHPSIYFISTNDLQSRCGRVPLLTNPPHWRPSKTTVNSWCLPIYQSMFEEFFHNLISLQFHGECS